PAAAGNALSNCPGRVDPSGKGDSRHARVSHELRANRLTPSRQEMQGARRNTRLMKEMDRVCGHDRWLFRRLCHDGVARRQRRRDLAREDREGEIPGTDCNENATPAPTEQRPVTAGSGTRSGELAPSLDGIISAEVDGLAYLCYRVEEIL